MRGPCWVGDRRSGSPRPAAVSRTRHANEQDSLNGIARPGITGPGSATPNAHGSHHPRTPSEACKGSTRPVWGHHVHGTGSGKASQTGTPERKARESTEPRSERRLCGDHGRGGDRGGRRSGKRRLDCGWGCSDCEGGQGRCGTGTVIAAAAVTSVRARAVTAPAPAPTPTAATATPPGSPLPLSSLRGRTSPEAAPDSAAHRS
jgi:hypothetical protein